MKTLLEKTRDINRLIQRCFSYPIIFKEISQVLRDTICADVYLLDRKGQVLGFAVLDNDHCQVMADLINADKQLPLCGRSDLLKMTEASTNLPWDGSCAFGTDRACLQDNKYTTFVPINCGGERLGTLMLLKTGEFDNNDLLLAEYGATIAGTEILRSKLEIREDVTRKKAAVSIAFDTLSHSELEAAGYIFKELGGKPGMIIGRKIAEKMRISRSVIVNGLRKLESAGVVEVHSGGMKGTHIRIINDHLLAQLEIIQTAQGLN